MNTYTYNHRPHADLMRLWPFSNSLGRLCGILGLESPKEGSVEASGVAEAVE